ncbi:MAG: 16S rRNA (guanine(527)-N(7))-methyltransferase RsmG [Victivallaceae bacterium]|nr:16S rRNA (guanine(527)-N(7))-methyltransferase RsmG [Victivallaceae bacterium]
MPDFEAFHLADAKAFTDRCEVLRALLIEGNARCNLTRITEKDEFFQKHVYDSLLIALEFPEIAEKPYLIADVGCGAGFPSLVLALAYPRLHITSIDSTGKKIDFVKSAAAALKLTNLTAIQGRAVELNRKEEFRHKFDLVTARAVAPSPKIAAETTNFLNRTGFYAFYKTPNQAAEELPQLARDNRYKWRVSVTRTLDYGERCFVTGEKKA